MEKGQCHKSLKECIQCQWLNDDWNSNNYFTKYSNVAQADHMKVKEQILMKGREYPQGVKKGDYLRQIYQELPESEKMRMREIEHLRWMRYHYMYNWDYAPKKEKDKHRHNLLVDFDMLSESEKVKDDDTYKTMFEIYNLQED